MVLPVCHCHFLFVHQDASMLAVLFIRKFNVCSSVACDVFSVRTSMPKNHGS
jgi:hypothetical protein